MKKRTKIIWWSVFGILALLIWYFLIGIESNRPGSFYNKKHNAIWLEHEWVDTRKSKEEIYDLVNNLILVESSSINKICIYTSTLTY